MWDIKAGHNFESDKSTTAEDKLHHGLGQSHSNHSRKALASTVDEEIIQHKQYQGEGILLLSSWKRRLG